MADGVFIGYKAIIKYENIDYYWHGKHWTTNRNITISTSLSQRLMLYAIKIGALTPEDFRNTTNETTDYKQITKTEADLVKK